MKNGKLLIGAGALASVVVLGGGWLLGASPLLAAAAASDQQVANTRQLNELQAARLAQLQAVGTDLSTLESQLADLRKVLPAGVATDDFVGHLSALEAATGAKVATLTSGMPVLVGTEVGATEASSSATESDPSSESRGRAETAAPTTTTSTGAAQLEVPGLLSIPLTLSVTGPDGAVRDFLARLQADGRFVSISNLVVGVDSADDNTTRLDVTGNLFVLPATT